jgi:hydroxyquinol 1,2-dioxygenase
MRNFTEENLTEAVLERLAGTKDPRLKEILTSLVQHLHAFVRDVELTEAEWFEGIKFLTATGHKCDAKRQEFILLSDTLGVSMLVDAINHRKPAGATETTVFGPFHREGAPVKPYGASIADGARGEPTFVSGRVLTADGKPLANAELDVWQVDGEGLYDVQRPDLAGMQMRGKFGTDAQGRYLFRTVKPVSYSIPTDGPVGAMLLATERHPYRPAHIHMIVAAPGYQPVTTHIFVAGDRYLDSDAVFAVKNSLIVDFKKRPAGPAPDGSTIGQEHWTAAYDFHLVPATNK